MNNQKIQITLTSQVVANLALNPLGYDATHYIKFLASRAAHSFADIPTFRMSKKLEKITEKAIEDYKNGKARLLYEI